VTNASAKAQLVALETHSWSASVPKSPPREFIANLFGRDG
jgi:hypothetical protein